jgi:uncharacterized protein
MPNNNPSGRNQYTKRKQHTPPSGDGSFESTASEQASNAPPAAMAPASRPAKRGFAAMDEATQRGIASKGGQSQGKENNPGNFANDRDRAREAGRKGGEAQGSNRSLS